MWSSGGKSKECSPKILYFLKRFYLFLFLERGRGREQEGEKHQRVLPLKHPILGTWTATQAWVLTGNQTSNLWFKGRCLIHWAIPFRADILKSYFFRVTKSRSDCVPWLSIYQSINLCIYPSIIHHLSFHPSTHLSVHPSMCISIWLIIFPLSFLELDFIVRWLFLEACINTCIWMDKGRHIYFFS